MSCLQTSSSSLESSSPKSSVPRWLSLEEPWHKINVDAAYFPDSDSIGIGCIIRNHLGQVIKTLSKNSHFNGDIEQVEAAAILEGIKLEFEAGVTPFLLESDALNVVKLCLGQTASLKDIDRFIQDIRSFLSNVSLVKLCFTLRCCNSSSPS